MPSPTSPLKKNLSALQFGVFEELGHGAYGAVYRGVDKATGTEVAIKQVDLESDENILEFKKEIALLSTCNNDYITNYYGCFVKGFKLWIVMEYLSGGSLSDLLIPGPLNEKIIGHLAHDIISGLHYLHESGKIHRDLKPANILIASDGTAKIADFGVSTQLSNKLSLRNTYIGTPYYMAPEVIAHHDYNFKADIWSLGITLLELANGKPPLYQYHPMQAVYLIERNEPPSLVGSEFSENFKDFVNSCLKRDPQERPTAKHLLKHKFLTMNNVAVSQAEILKLVQRKKHWDDHGNHGQPRARKFYTPTIESPLTPSATSEDSTEFDFDIPEDDLPQYSGEHEKEKATLTIGNVEREDDTLKQKKKKGIEQNDEDRQSLIHDLNSILNQAFNKISSKINLTTYQYDHLVNFKTEFLKDSVLDEQKRNRDIFQIFFKNFMKRVYNSDNQQLKEKFLPKLILENQEELFQLRKEKQQWALEAERNHQANIQTKTSQRSRDNVEELLLSRWAENMIERWTH